MEISEKAWNAYIKKLSRIRDKSTQMMDAWIQKNGIEDVDAMVEYGRYLTDRYGAAASELSCEMYDEIAERAGVVLPPAVPAQPLTMEQIEKILRGALKQSQLLVAPAVGTEVKRSGADTIINNAKRDNAEIAWIFHGETCVYCLALASRGWQRAPKGTHEAHFHNHCDCEYCVRFKKTDGLRGYSPDKLLKQYKEIPGKSFKEKQRNYEQQYAAEHPEELAARKHAEYMRRKELNSDDLSEA